MEKLKNICQDIKDNGGQAYLVGGYVRDMILDRTSKDMDVEVFNISPDDLLKILSKYGKVNHVGKSFGVFKLEHYDFSLPRREEKIGKGHTEFEIKVDPTMTKEEACQRRDLTINALMLCPLTEELIDLVDGLTDLEDKKIKHVGDRFVEDPLRVLRVAQFAARFEFDVDKETTELSKQLLDELGHLPSERLFTELEKIMLKCDKPSIAFRWLEEIGALEVIFPEIANLRNIKQGEKYHHGLDVLEHTLLALDHLPLEIRELDVMLAILCHDLGKGQVEAEIDGDSTHFFGHAEAGERITRKFLSRITNETKLTESVVNLVVHHMRFYDLKRNLKKRLVRRLSLHVDMPKLVNVHRADKMSRTDDDVSYIGVISELYEEIVHELKPLVGGKHLIEMGLPPSKEFGRILREVFDAQIDEKFSTLEEGLEFAQNLLKLRASEVWMNL